MSLVEKYKKVNEEVDTELNKRKKIISDLERAEAALSKAQSDENKELQKLKLQTQEANKEAKLQAQIASEQEGSLKKLRAELILLTSQYDKLSAAERNEASGKELETKIKNLTKEVSDLEQNTGRFQRNVGNYSSAFKGLKGNISGIQDGFNQIKSGDVAGGFDTISESSKGLGKNLLAFLVSPIGIVIGVVTGLIVSLKAWYDYNEKISGQTSFLKKTIGTQGESLKALRADIQATAETMKVDFMSMSKVIDDALDLGLAKDEFSALASIQKGLLQAPDKNEFLSQLQNNAIAAKNLGMDLDQLRGFILAVEQNGGDATAILGAMQKGSQNLATALSNDKLKSSLNNAFGSVFTNDILQKIKTGELSTIDALQKISFESQKVGLNVSQQAELAKQMFGKSAIAAGGYELVLKNVADSYELQNKKLSPLQESNLKLTELTALQERAWAGLFDQTGGGFEKMKVDFKLMTAKYILEFIQWIYKAVNGFIDLYNESNIFRAAITSIGVSFKNSFGFTLLLLKEIWIGLKAIGSDAVDIFTSINKSIDNLKSGNFRAAANDITSITTKLALNHVKQFNESKKAVQDYANDVKNNMKSVADAYNSNSKLKRFEIPKANKNELGGGNLSGNPYSDGSNDPTSGELENNKKLKEDKKKTSEELQKIAYANAKAEIEARKISLEYLQKFWSEEKASIDERQLFYENFYSEQFSLLEAEKNLELSNAKSLGDRNKIIEKYNLDRLNLEKQQVEKLKNIQIESVQNSENQYKLSNQSILENAIDLTDKLVENEKNRINKILDFELELLNKKFDLTEKEIQNKLDAGEKLTKAEIDYLTAVKEARKKAKEDILKIDEEYYNQTRKHLEAALEIEKLKRGEFFNEDTQAQLDYENGKYNIEISSLKNLLEQKKITDLDYKDQLEKAELEHQEKLNKIKEDGLMKAIDLQSEYVDNLDKLKQIEVGIEGLYNAKSEEDKIKSLAKISGGLKSFAKEGSATWKALAMLQATLNMYIGITEALKEKNMFLRIAGIALATTTGLMAISKINSVNTPKYKDGTLYAERTGTAITDEEGPELHFDRNWKLKDRGSSGGARYKQVSQGDKIIPADITKMINSLSIPLSNISKIQNNQSIDYDKLADKIAKRAASENMRALESQKKEYFIPGLNGEIIKVESQNGMTTIHRKTEPKPTGQILQ